ncbi:hypothetical protein KM043_013031 [Ampulex compressa]|uniref:Venom protein n=1 Tax=Ampulex compressa TaxID=860918 RepID=A0A1W6EWD7_AMPCP|nr:venom protein [Ampulex compressa]KAG7212770.1 hypothetical protein KM043_013031 [Ampulex compressa]
MWSKFFGFFLLVAVLCLAVAAQEEQRQCVTGKSYYDGCNWCSCHGKGVACTLKYCQIRNEDGSVSPHVPIPPPDDFWQN